MSQFRACSPRAAPCAPPPGNAAQRAAWQRPSPRQWCSSSGAAPHRRSSSDRRPRLLAPCRSFDPSSSPLLSSEVFQREMMELDSSFRTVNQMMPKFPDFDLEGKKIFIGQMEQLAEKVEVLMARIKLVNDPLGNMAMQALQVQMLEASTSMGSMVGAFKAELADMRKLVELEETSADPALLAAARAAMRQKFAAQFNPRLMDLMGDPEVAAGLMHPQALKAVKDCVEDPSRVEQYRNDPALYGMLKKVLST